MRGETTLKKIFVGANAPNPAGSEARAGLRPHQRFRAHRHKETELGDGGRKKPKTDEDVTVGRIVVVAEGTGQVAFRAVERTAAHHAPVCI